MTGPHHSPTLEPPLLGRERELEGVARLLAGGRLVTLVGPAGCGKTRLAREVAVRNPAAGRAIHVDVASLRQRELVSHAVASALGIADEPDRTLAQSAARLPSAAPALLVLDGCDLLSPACSDLAEELLRACPRLTIVATSREPLGTAGEWTYAVPPLDPGNAAHLLVERVRERWPERLAETTVEAERIAVLVDGLPLAIEIAAARAGDLGLASISAELAERLAPVVDAAATNPRRPQRLRATIAWSHDHLSDAEQHLLRRLCCFAGGATVEAAMAVVVGVGLLDFEVAAGLERLTDCALLRREGNGKEVLYHLPEPVRAFGRERLLAAREETSFRAAHLAYFAGWTESLAGAGTGNNPQTLQLVGRERANLGAAVRWAASGSGDIDAGLRLVTALAPLYERKGRLREGETALALALGAAPPLSADRPLALEAAARLARRLGQSETARRHLREALTLARDNSDFAAAARVLTALADLDSTDGDALHAARLIGAAVALAERARPRSPAVADTEPGRSLGRIQALLSPEALLQAAAEGQALSLEQAVELALRRSAPGDKAPGAG